MWVFAYGSLMSDGWEEKFKGVSHGPARLPDHRRSFNKKSTVNWGTGAAPCPTLGLERAKGTECFGLLFEIPDRFCEEVTKYLQKREGPSFELEELEVQLEDGNSIVATVAVNDHKVSTYIGNMSLEQRAAMVDSAAGSSGKCRDYVKTVRNELRQVGIEDPHVEKFWAAVTEVS